MQKDAFYQAVVGDLRFDAWLSADGPYISAYNLAENRPVGGAALAASGLRRFLPSQFGLGFGPWAWYIVKRTSDARVLLDGFTTEQLDRMRAEFGLLPTDKQDQHGGPARAFYASRAWSGLVPWVRQHPHAAKRLSQYDACLPGWHGHAWTARGESVPSRCHAALN